MTAYGWTPEQINSARQEWSRQRTPTSNGGVGAPKAEKPSLNAQQAMEAYLKGITTPQVLAALVYHYGSEDPYGLLGTQPDTPTANPKGPTGMDKRTLKTGDATTPTSSQTTQIGAGAKLLQSQIMLPGMPTAQKATAIETALNRGTITESEAGYLLTTIGY